MFGEKGEKIARRGKGKGESSRNLNPVYNLVVTFLSWAPNGLNESVT